MRLKLVNPETDYAQVEYWIETYNKETQPLKKKQLLTLIVLACKELVNKISYGLARRSSDPVEDIIQVGNLGLLNAVQRYDNSYNNIKSYLTTSIVGEIKHYLRDKVQTIKAPRSIVELSYRINKLSIENIEKAGIQYEQKFIQQKFNVSEEKAREVLEFERRNVISLDQIQFSGDEESKTIIENLADKQEELNKELKENKILLKDAIAKLPQKLQDIINAIYFDNVYQKELAEQMHTTQSNISRMQKRALKMLFKIITDNKEK